jgi:hypothetical protein
VRILRSRPEGRGDPVSSIRFLARELYRLTKTEEELARSLAALKPDAPLSERTRLEAAILQARKEVEHYRQLISAKKEKPLI